MSIHVLGLSRAITDYTGAESAFNADFQTCLKAVVRESNKEAATVAKNEYLTDKQNKNLKNVFLEYIKGSKNLSRADKAILKMKLNFKTTTVLKLTETQARILKTSFTGNKVFKKEIKYKGLTKRQIDEGEDTLVWIKSEIYFFTVKKHDLTITYVMGDKEALDAKFKSAKTFEKKTITENAKNGVKQSPFWLRNDEKAFLRGLRNKEHEKSEYIDKEAVLEELFAIFSQKQGANEKYSQQLDKDRKELLEEIGIVNEELDFEIDPQTNFTHLFWLNRTQNKLESRVKEFSKPILAKQKDYVALQNKRVKSGRISKETAINKVVRRNQNDSQKIREFRDEQEVVLGLKPQNKPQKEINSRKANDFKIWYEQESIRLDAWEKEAKKKK